MYADLQNLRVSALRVGLLRTVGGASAQSILPDVWHYQKRQLLVVLLFCRGMLEWTLRDLTGFGIEPDSACVVLSGHSSIRWRIHTDTRSCCKHECHASDLRISRANSFAQAAHWVGGREDAHLRSLRTTGVQNWWLSVVVAVHAAPRAALGRLTDYWSAKTRTRAQTSLGVPGLRSECRQGRSNTRFTPRLDFEQ